MGIIVELFSWRDNKKRAKQAKARREHNKKVLEEVGYSKWSKYRSSLFSSLSDDDKALREWAKSRKKTIKDVPIGKLGLSYLSRRNGDRNLISFKLKYKRRYKHDDVLCNDIEQSATFFRFALRGIERFKAKQSYRYCNNDYEYDKDYNRIPKNTYARAHPNDDLLDALKLCLSEPIDYERYEREKAERAKWNPEYDIFEACKESKETREAAFERDKKAVIHWDEIQKANELRWELAKNKWSGEDRWALREQKDYEDYRKGKKP